ncbi:hypothetical protein [Actinomadura rubrisoli]|nr:hypothetical protein [Actinomadura rubrisoli]
MFEQPPCPDGHGEECPERACVDCGSAVLVGSPPAGPVPADAASPAERSASVRAVA